MLKGITGEMMASHLPKKPSGSLQLKETCAEFESLLLNHIMKSMRSTVPGNEFFGGSHGGEIVRSMFDESLSSQMASGGGIGLGRVLFEQLKDRVE